MIVSLDVKTHEYVLAAEKFIGLVSHGLSQQTSGVRFRRTRTVATHAIISIRRSMPTLGPSYKGNTLSGLSAAVTL